MKAGNAIKVPLLRLTLVCTSVLALGAMGCNGAISDEGMPATGSNTGAAGSGDTNPTGSAGNVTQMPPQTGGTSGSTGPLDSGRIDVHRLNNLEYDNTVHDLLGVQGMAEATFQPDEECEFDNCADAFTMNDARYEQYFDSADTLGEQVFADTSATGLRQTYVYGLVNPPCTPSATDTTCSSKIISAFAAKAWRHPLASADLTGLVKVATDAIALGETADGSIKQVVKVVLSSPQFLYRIELDPNPNSTVAHAVDPYDLATRLSYLVYSSMPDQMLFDLAASTQIQTPSVLTAQVDRMLADPKGAAFTNSFAGQWLGGRDMQAHQVEPTAFPEFDDALRSAMVTEDMMYFDEFLTGGLSFNKFFTTPENFINTRLAQHYGMPAPSGTGFVKVTNADPNRIGFLGLGSFLTISSYSYRTAPTIRGKWVLLYLLCQTIPSPPPGVPTLDGTAQATDASVQQEDVRARLEAHRQASTCAACHATLDPIGLGLENFDGVGKYRTKYAPTDTSNIDASGMLPTGETFSSVAQLAGILAGGTHLQQSLGCASQKMMTYALSRELTSTDQPYLNQVQTAWAKPGTYSLKDLMKIIVTNDTFRFRRGEDPSM